jgi:hypothetical protein
MSFADGAVQSDARTLLVYGGGTVFAVVLMALLIAAIFQPVPVRQVNPGAVVPIRVYQPAAFRAAFPELPQSTAACRWSDDGRLVEIALTDSRDPAETCRQVVHEILKHASPNHALLRDLSGPQWDVFTCGPRKTLTNGQ